MVFIRQNFVEIIKIVIFLVISLVALLFDLIRVAWVAGLFAGLEGFRLFTKVAKKY